MTPETTLSTRWNLSHVAQRARQIVREEGLRSLWFKILGEVCYRRAIFFVCELEKASSEAPSSLPVELNTLQSDEIHEYLALYPGNDPDDIRRRLASGHTCFTARLNGQLIHVCWAATGHAWIAYLAREIQLAPDEVYSYELYTAPAFRGSNVTVIRSAYMQQTLHRAGYRRAFAVVMPENKTGYRAVEKAGYRPMGMLRTFWFCKWRCNFGRIAARPSIYSA
jgi:hypothetical protein